MSTWTKQVCLVGLACLALLALPAAAARCAALLGIGLLARGRQGG